MDLESGRIVLPQRGVPYGVPSWSQVISARCFPPDDPGFAAHVERALRDLDHGSGDGIGPADLEQALRRIFPRVRVHERSPLADLGDGATAWYVYRDGHFDAHPGPGGWWLDRSLPRVLLDAGGRCVDASAAAQELLGRPAERLAGRPLADCAPTGARDYLAMLPDLARHIGDVDTTCTIERPGGERLEVGLHLSIDRLTARRLVVLRRL